MKLSVMSKGLRLFLVWSLLGIEAPTLDAAPPVSCIFEGALSAQALFSEHLLTISAPPSLKESHHLERSKARTSLSLNFLLALPGLPHGMFWLMGGIGLLAMALDRSMAEEEVVKFLKTGSPQDIETFLKATYSEPLVSAEVLEVIRRLNQNHPSWLPIDLEHALSQLSFHHTMIRPGRLFSSIRRQYERKLSLREATPPQTRAGKIAKRSVVNAADKILLKVHQKKLQQSGIKMSVWAKAAGVRRAQIEYALSGSPTRQDGFIERLIETAERLVSQNKPDSLERRVGVAARFEHHRVTLADYIPVLPVPFLGLTATSDVKTVIRKFEALLKSGKLPVQTPDERRLRDLFLATLTAAGTFDATVFQFYKKEGQLVLGLSPRIRQLMAEAA